MLQTLNFIYLSLFKDPKFHFSSLSTLNIFTKHKYLQLRHKHSKYHKN